VSVAHLRPVTFAHERLLPVAAPLAPLLPHAGLPRGGSVAIAGGAGSSSVALALVAEASRLGSWVAIVGWPSVGLAAAAELGVALDRVMVVDVDAERFGAVVAALVDAVDIVIARPPRSLATSVARRLTARARERGAVLVLTGRAAGPIVVGAFDPLARIEVRASTWVGLESGHGTLRARRLTIEASVRRDGRPRRTTVWLPGPDGVVCAVDAADVVSDMTIAPVPAASA
jgi:hypothetical protein